MRSRVRLHVVSVGSDASDVFDGKERLLQLVGVPFIGLAEQPGYHEHSREQPIFAEGRKGEFEDAPIAIVEGDENRTGRQICFSAAVGEKIMERDRLVSSRAEIAQLGLELL